MNQTGRGYFNLYSRLMAVTGAMPPSSRAGAFLPGEQAALASASVLPLGKPGKLKQC